MALDFKIDDRLREKILVKLRIIFLVTFLAVCVVPGLVFTTKFLRQGAKEETLSWHEFKGRHDASGEKSWLTGEKQEMVEDFFKENLGYRHELMNAGIKVNDAAQSIWNWSGIWIARLRTGSMNLDTPPLVAAVAGVKFEGDQITLPFRRKTCFLQTGDNIETFAPECSGDMRRPLVLLWGDSRAAALYSGLQSLQQKYEFGIAQFTASWCKPIVNWKIDDNKLCQRFGPQIFEQIKALKPDIVLMHAAWSFSDDAGLEETIQMLKDIGVPRVVLVGQTPAWHEPIPKLVYNYYLKENFLIPERTSYGSDDFNKILDGDELLQKAAERTRIPFVSLRRALCNEQGCLIRNGETLDDLFCLDNGHLAPAGSRFVMNEIAVQLFGEKFSELVLVQ